MLIIRNTLIGMTLFAVIYFTVALSFVLVPNQGNRTNEDVFGFSSVESMSGNLPDVERYAARDGSQLAYRFYDSVSENVLVFIHGSSYHGSAYHELASTLSSAGIAKVYLPNLRGHYLSGKRRGDVAYIGQLEDDIADLISLARDRGQGGRIYIGGHSSGAGLVIRFAGGNYRDMANGYVLLSPVIPTGPAMKGGDAGGWASLNQPRMYGLLALNAVGIGGLNGLPIIEFNKPEEFWDGTETLSYSYRLNQSYHPRFDYDTDILAMGNKVIVIVGENDEAVNSSELVLLFAAAEIQVVVLPGVNHFGVFRNSLSFSAIGKLLEE
ncbi:MAG: alpha/beta fold hydrolase [Pseudomonadales bacterium]